MKTRLFLLLFACIALMACEKKDRSDEIIGGPPGPPGYLIVVQLPDAQQTQTAIVENPVVRVDYSTWPETPIFDENVLEPKVSDLLSTWPKDSLKMLEHSPYIELGDNYYLLDWRWRGALPFFTRLAYGGGPDSIYIAHWFVTDVAWKDISLLQDWSEAQIIGHPNVTAMGIISPEQLDEYFGTLIPRDNPYWVTVYWWGGPTLRYDNPQITIWEYIDFLDQLQERYRDYLIRLIQEGKFNEFYYQP